MPGPLTHGSIFTVLNLHHGLSPSGAMEEMRRQAARAIELGFDGVGIGEHHGGFPGYMPAPLQAAGLILAGAPRGWAAAVPIILPLRSVAGVVEEAAWLDACFPGRVVVGFAAGYQEDDFRVFGIPFDERFVRFRTMFEQVAAALGGEGRIETLSRDPAITAAAGRIGLMMNTRGCRNARLAARTGAALSPTQLTDAAYRELFGVYRGAGGTGARVVQRWVFLGDPPASEIESLNRGYDAAPGDHSWSDAASRIVPLADREPERMAARLIAWMRASDATALTVRFHLGPLRAGVVREQMERFAVEVLPLLRRGVGAIAAAEVAAAAPRASRDLAPEGAAD